MANEELGTNKVVNATKTEKVVTEVWSLRMPRGFKDLFKTAAEQRDISQPQLMMDLYEKLEQEDAEALHPGRADEIRAMKQHLEAIMTHYTNALAITDTAVETVRQEFADKVQAQADTIAELRKQSDELQSLLTSKDEEIAGLKKQVSDLNECVEQKQKEIDARGATIEALQDNRALMEKLSRLLVTDQHGAVAVASTLFDDDNADASADDAQKSRKKSHGAS